MLTATLAIACLAGYFSFQALAPAAYMVSLPSLRVRSLGLYLWSSTFVEAIPSWGTRCSVLDPCLVQDEIFHVPQTQRYCAGRWREWDDKITTFPGLYLLGVAFGRVHHALAAALHRQVGAWLRAPQLAAGCPACRSAYQLPPSGCRLQSG